MLLVDRKQLSLDLADIQILIALLDQSTNRSEFHISDSTKYFLLPWFDSDQETKYQLSNLVQLGKHLQLRHFPYVESLTK